MNKPEIILTEGISTTFDLIKEEEIKKRFGFVAILDALGTKNKDFKSILKFLNNNLLVLSLFKNNFGELLRKITVINERDNRENKLDFFAFQDTIIITFDVNNKNFLLEYLNYFGTLVQYHVSSSFINHILFRGAISFGEYYEYSNHFYFGEAINEAAEWYEQPDFIGVITTPQLTKLANLLFQKLDENQIDLTKFDRVKFRELFVLTNAPTKKCDIECYTVTWPLALSYQNTLPEDNIGLNNNAHEVFKLLIKKFDIPIGSESKYINTNQFVNGLFEAFPEKLNFSREELQKQIILLKGDETKA